MAQIELPDPYPDDTVHPYWVPESGQHICVDGPDRVSIELTARWRRVDAQTARSIGLALLAAAQAAEALIAESFPCVVDDCPERFTSHDALNRHSRAVHSETIHRYPGVDGAGDFRWHSE